MCSLMCVAQTCVTTEPSPRQDREHIRCPKSSLLLRAIPTPLSTHCPSVHLSAATRDQILFSGTLYKGNPTVCVPVWLLLHPKSILNLAVLWVAVVWVFILLHLFSVWHSHVPKCVCVTGERCFLGSFFIPGGFQESVSLGRKPIYAPEHIGNPKHA